MSGVDTTYNQWLQIYHCYTHTLLVSSAGVGRTGTFIAIDNILEQVKKEGIVDVSGVITKMRHQRMKMVQTPVSIIVYAIYITIMTSHLSGAVHIHS